MLKVDCQGTSLPFQHQRVGNLVNYSSTRVFLATLLCFLSELNLVHENTTTISWLFSSLCPYRVSSFSPSYFCSSRYLTLFLFDFCHSQKSSLERVTCLLLHRFEFPRIGSAERKVYSTYALANNLASNQILMFIHPYEIYARKWSSQAYTQPHLLCQRDKSSFLKGQAHQSYLIFVSFSLNQYTFCRTANSF